MSPPPAPAPVSPFDPERLRVALERELCGQLDEDRAFQRIREIIVVPDAKAIRRRLMANALMLTEGMAPEIHAYAREAMAALGVDEPIEIYQASGRENAAMHAVEAPVLLEIQGRLLTLLDRGAAIAVFGHELGHFLAHGPGTDLGATGRFAAAIANADGIELHLQQTCSALSMAKELTADRFGLLACRDLDAVLRLEMISTTGLPGSALTWDTAAYLAQAKALIEQTLAEGEAAHGVTHPEHSVRAWAAWLFSESDVYKELTGQGPGTRTLAEIDALLAKVLHKRDLDAYHVFDEAPRDLHECALACAVFVAAADGEISEVEGAAIERVFAPIVPDWRWYLSIENAQQRFSEVGGVIAWAGDEVKKSLFHLLVHVVGADGVVHDSEVEMVVAIGDALGCGTMYRALLRPFLRHFGLADRDLQEVRAAIPMPPRPGEAREALRAFLRGFVRRRGGETTLRRLLRVVGERARTEKATALLREEIDRAALFVAPGLEVVELDELLQLAPRDTIDEAAPRVSHERPKPRETTRELEVVARAIGRLREKLVSGDGRSPSIRLYGPRAGRAFDLHALEELSIGLCERVLAQVREGDAAKLVIAAESGRHDGGRRIVAELIELEREARGRFEETGARDLYLGHPFLTGVVDGYLFRAPLVLYPVDLDRDDRGARSFSVRPRKDEPPVPNHALIRLLFHRRDFALPDDLVETLDTLAADPGAGAEAMLAELKKLGVEAVKLTGAIVPLRERDEELSGWRGNRFEIEECAVLGLFPQSGSDLLQDYDGLLADLASSEREPTDLLACARELLPAEVRDAFPAIEETPPIEARLVPVVHADPSQEEVVRRVRRTRAIVVDGPPGTGKSQVIVNLVADAIGRGERVAVVCEKRAALDVVAQRLDGSGFRDAFALVHDVREDRRAVYKHVAARLEAPRDRKHSPDAAEELHGRFHRVHEVLDARGRTLARKVDGTTLTVGAVHALIAGLDAPELAGAELLHRVTEGQLPKLVDQLGALRPYVDLLQSSPFASERPSLDAVSESEALGLERAFDAAIKTAHAFEALDRADLDATDEARAALERLRASRTLREGEGARLFVRVVRRAADDPDDLARIEHLQTTWSAHRDATHRVGDRVAIETSPEAERALATTLAWAGRFLRFFVIAWWMARGAVRRTLLTAWPERAADPLDRALLESLRDRLAASKAWRALEAVGERFAIPIASAAASGSQLVDRLVAVRAIAGEVARRRKALARAGAWPDALDDDALDTWERTIDARLAVLAAKDAHAEASRALSERFPALGPLPTSEALRTFGHAWRRDGLRVIELDRRRASARATFPEVDGLVSSLVAHDSAIWRDAITRAWGASHLAVLERSAPEIAALDRPTAHGDEAAAAAELAALHDRMVEDERARVLSRLDGAAVLNVALPLKGRRRTADQAAREQMLKECRKQRSIMPMRAFVRAFAPKGLLDVVPAWLLSPETMAVLFPREPLFDLVIFDEASQCTVENGVSVLLRARRVVIAGDEKQMPPARYFDAQLVDEPEETSDATQETETLDAESLLTLARARVPHVGLQWHYRCREEGLIAFSNHAMYGGSLLTIPSTSTRAAPPALQWIACEDGAYESGRNPNEARRVVRLIAELLGRGERPSIGVVTFNLQQRKAILDAIDERRAEDAEFAARWDAAVANDKLDERPFVKNLENVQGDERDVIVFSLGHAPIERRLRGVGTGERYVPSRFGPLGQAGGERRLNVAISRAKTACVVVASFTPEMLSVATTKHDGPKLFKAFLEFAHHLSAQRRLQAERVLDQVRDEALVHVRRRARTIDYVPLSVQVAEALRALGLACELDVGTSRFRVPVAVIDRGDPARYRVAVFCDDGEDDAAAFERFVHRERVLAARGWKLVRVTARAWARNRAGEIERIVAATA
ncbi:MAG: DUF4011 domain-containing protein [Deltaproteobacteria bacterium]|nr:DUF4011 domain-containing protein [Deltaproteobacteria bacterium]